MSEFCRIIDRIQIFRRNRTQIEFFLKVLGSTLIISSQTSLKSSITFQQIPAATFATKFELCGECGRWYLLKRNAAFETRLAAYNKRAAEHFKKEFYLRPIPTKYLDAINNPAEFGQNAGY